MPGMTLEEFLKQTKLLNLQLVLMTGYGDAVRITELYGMTSSLQKPIPPEAILRILKKIVGD
jgi:hypothetical protein